MKKSTLLSALAFLIFGLSMGNVSAYYAPSVRGVVEDIINSWIDIGEPILEALFGGFGWSSLYMFERLLLFLLLVSIIWVSIGKIDLFNNNKVVRWIISLVVPLIGIRFIDYEWLTSLLYQYELLAIVLTSVLPFIIYFFFLYNISGDHGVLRKIGWAAFMAVYAGLWSSAQSEINSSVYFWTMVASAVCLFGDNLINRRLRALTAMKQNRYFVNDEVTRINQRVYELNQSIVNHTAYDPAATKAQIKDLEKHKSWLLKQ